VTLRFNCLYHPHFARTSAELRDAVGEEDESESSPLVWFLFYKGEQWRVAAAFITHEIGGRTYVRIIVSALGPLANRMSEL